MTIMLTAAMDRNGMAFLAVLVLLCGLFSIRYAGLYRTALTAPRGRNA